jgi:hypothetical protein
MIASISTPVSVRRAISSLATASTTSTRPAVKVVASISAKAMKASTDFRRATDQRRDRARLDFIMRSSRRQLGEEQPLGRPPRQQRDRLVDRPV